MPEKRVLFVDDDREILQIHKQYMEKKGYTVAVCPDGESALNYLSKNQADCIVLDVMMPGPDGFEILPKIRQLSDAPVLYLSGRTGDEDRIKGLTLGADDYISKPCSLEELGLRIDINIRKSNPLPKRDNILEYPPLTIERNTHKVYCRDEEVLLSNREYDLLLLFAENAGKTLTYEQIGIAMTGIFLPADRQTVMMNVSRLRKRLEAYAKAANMIETVWGEGYRFRTVSSDAK